MTADSAANGSAANVRIRDMNRPMYTILKGLDGQRGPLSSKEMATMLIAQGMDISERTVRYYLKKCDEMGYTLGCAKKGREITEKGRQELSQGFVSQRVGFVINRINNLSFLMDFNIERGQGKVILNLTYVEERKLKDALKVLSAVLKSPYSMSDRVVVARSGERLGDVVVPPGRAAIGTMCSITLNSIFLKSGIPVTSRLGGIVEVVNSKPTRFISHISYEGSSVAPLEIFLKSKLTDVLGALNSGSGVVLGSFREIPADSVEEARRITGRLNKYGFKCAIIFGRPGEPLLGVPVGEGRAGMAVLGGLNPNAALEEAGLSSGTNAMTAIVDYLSLGPLETYGELNGNASLDRGLVAYLNRKRQLHNDGYWSVLREL